jgi:hypothetical protein
MDLSEYCRDLETYLCRKNDGHLIRIVGPSFEVVSRWAAQGVPLKVAMGGIDRYFERYYRQGPRRRPVKIDFCEADVLDLFDEWRRATGVSASTGPAESADGAAEPARKRGPSLREHLERVLIRLSSLRATGTLGVDADPLIDSVSAELEQVKARSALRGEARTALVARLGELDMQLVELVRQSIDPAVMADVQREAAEELAPFRASMPSEAYAQAVSRATVKALRERLHLPMITFT